MPIEASPELLEQLRSEQAGNGHPPVELSDDAAAKIDVPPGPGSFRQRLQAARKDGAQRQWMDFPLPGYDGIVVRCGKLPYEDVNNCVVGGVSNDPQVKLAAYQDALIKACVEFMYVQDGVPVSIADRLRDEGEDVKGPIQFHNAPEALGIDVGPDATAREKTLAVFGEAPTPGIAILEMGIGLIAWLTGKQEEIDRLLLEGP